MYITIRSSKSNINAWRSPRLNDADLKREVHSPKDHFIGVLISVDHYLLSRRRRETFPHSVTHLEGRFSNQRVVVVGGKVAFIV